MNNYKYPRVFLIVLDSVGIGNAKDAYKFGDEGANTLNNIDLKVGLNLPNLEKMGLGNIYPIKNIKSVLNPTAYVGFLESASVGKDSVAGHWEIMGCIIDKPFNNFCKNGFPKDLILKFEKEIGINILGNKEANGMNIIKEFWNEHLETKSPIVYTSVDSTFQIAAHEEIIPINKLYDFCKIARKLTLEKNEWLVSRVIARPFIGNINSYSRTDNRHDYALNPFSPIVLSLLKENNLDVIALGKINDLYNGVGITKSIKTKNNEDGINQLIKIANENFTGLCFLNLVDFDSVYGHVRDVKGYKNALEYFDLHLPKIINSLNENDILILTADHGNDPTFKGNDHTRENVPLIVYSKSFKNTSTINSRKTFADIGNTIANNFNLFFKIGNSFLDILK